MPGFGIGMINDDFHIAGIRQVVAERLKRVAMYSMALGPRCFKWKILSLSGPNAFLFLQQRSNDLSLHEVELSGNYRCQQIEINSYPDSPHTSLRMSGGAIPASKYRSSTLVGFRHPVTALHALFSYGFSFWA